MNQAIVETPLGGRGLVLQTRSTDSIKEIQLLEWPAMLYTTQTFPSVKPLLGDHVMTQFGRGLVIQLRSAQVVVQLTSWRLAQRSRVTCYLQPTQVKVLRQKTLAEMDTYERVECAQQLKLRANAAFTNKQYDDALLIYAQAVDAVRYVQHDAQSNNHVRADLIVLMVTCCNNAATCCIKLHKWDDAIKFSNNALVLLDALYQKRGMNIHTILLQQNYHHPQYTFTDAQIFGEWKLKSYLITARANMERHDHDLAAKTLALAQQVIHTYNTPQLQLQQKQLTLLQTHCGAKRALERKKEKQRAQAMFATTATTAATTATTTKGAPLVSAPLPPPENKSSTTPLKKKVSFKNPLAEDDEEEDYDKETAAEHTPWYHEHFEALLLLAGATTAAIAILILSNKKLQR